MCFFWQIGISGCQHGGSTWHKKINDLVKASRMECIRTYIPYIPLHYTTVHYSTLHYTTTLRYTALQYITLHFITLHCPAFHSIPFHSQQVLHPRFHEDILPGLLRFPRMGMPPVIHFLFRIWNQPSSSWATTILGNLHMPMVFPNGRLTGEGLGGSFTLPARRDDPQIRNLIRMKSWFLIKIWWWIFSLITM